MDELTFWLNVWKAILVAVVAAFVSVGGCMSYSTHLVAEAVKGGADPIAASCGIGNAPSDGRMCAIAAAKR